MSKRLAAGILLLAGLSILLVSLLANVVGQLAIGARLDIGQDPGFGPQQLLGTIVGLIGVASGVWLWRQPEAEELGTGRLAIALLAFVVVVGGPILVLATTSLQQYGVLVTPCLEVEEVPLRAGGAGQRRVNYGVWVENTGTSVIQVDSVVLMAFRDSATWSLDSPEIVAIDDVVLWEPVDSASVTRATITLRSGRQVRFMRSVIVPVEWLSSLHLFRGTVYFGHRGPATIGTGAVWLESAREECG